jgi:hypothetical protein
MITLLHRSCPYCVPGSMYPMGDPFSLEGRSMANSTHGLAVVVSMVQPRRQAGSRDGRR